MRNTILASAAVGGLLMTTFAWSSAQATNLPNLKSALGIGGVVTLVQRGVSTGRYTYRGGGGKRYAYRADFKGHDGRFRRYRWYNRTLFSYGYGGCGWMYRHAISTGDPYWWKRYKQCQSATDNVRR